MQYREHEIDGRRVIVYRDLPGHEEEKANYQRHIDAGDAGHACTKPAEKAPYLGAYVLQTSLSKGSRTVGGRFILRLLQEWPGWAPSAHRVAAASRGLSLVMLVAGLIECEVRGTWRGRASSGAAPEVADGRYFRNLQNSRLTRLSSLLY